MSLYLCQHNLQTGIAGKIKSAIIKNNIDFRVSVCMPVEESGWEKS